MFDSKRADHIAANIRTLRGTGIDDENDETDPHRVVPVQTKEKLSNAGLRHVFPHESVTVIAFHKAGSQ